MNHSHPKNSQESKVATPSKRARLEKLLWNGAQPSTFQGANIKWPDALGE